MVAVNRHFPVPAHLSTPTGLARVFSDCRPLMYKARVQTWIKVCCDGRQEKGYTAMLLPSLGSSLLLSSPFLGIPPKLQLSQQHAWTLPAAVKSAAQLQQKPHEGNPWEAVYTRVVPGAGRKPFQTTPPRKIATSLRSLLCLQGTQS